MRIMKTIGVMFVSGILVALSVSTASSDENGTGGKTQFDKEYENLLSEAVNTISPSSDQMTIARGLPSTGVLSKHGVAILPFLMEKLATAEQDKVSAVAQYGIVAVTDNVTKRSFYRPQEVVTWWQSAGKDTKQQFTTLYESWQKAVKELTDANKPLLLKSSETVIDAGMNVVTTTNETALGKIYRQIRELGIEILPMLLDITQKGDYTLLPLVSELTDNQVQQFEYPENRVKKFALWWKTNKAAYAIPFPGTTPPAPETPPANDNTAPGGESGGPTPPPPPVLPIEPSAPPAEGGTNPPASGGTQP